MAENTAHGLTVRSFAADTSREIWLNSSTENSGIEAAISEAAGVLKDNNCLPVSVRLFGESEAVETVRKTIAGALGGSFVTPILINQPGTGVGVQVHGVSQECLTPIFYNGDSGPGGYEFRDKWGSYYMLNVLPDDTNCSAEQQAGQVFEKLDKVMRKAGGDFNNTARTWLFARDILSWYGGLNKTRDKFFNEHGVFDRLVPASTGIGVDNHCGAAIAAQAFAVAGGDKLTVARAESPLQCSAMDYKSSFSRAVKVANPEYERLFISGTASIDEHGNTVRLGDTPGQVELTMRVVEAILEKAGMGFGDVVSSIVYFKDAGEFGLFDEYCLQHGLELPHVKVHADVCRDDLLFEIEIDAVKSRA